MYVSIDTTGRNIVSIIFGNSHLVAQSTANLIRKPCILLVFFIARNMCLEWDLNDIPSTFWLISF